MLTLAQQAATAVNLASNESASEQVSALNAAAQAALPDIYAVLGGTADNTSPQTELLAPPRWTPRSPRAVPPIPSGTLPTGRRPPCSIPAMP
ncbi:hypothetical protein [Faecalibacterium sp. OF04-11AC]|uniref:hypothetical protein n=1 Tax=Faecalibacterium sp. OF04-11AC TaxID=2293109 RepID=UPI001FA8DB36|nr:hypothetical protein [Faecalibacterium sp. OF04-11AC]